MKRILFMLLFAFTSAVVFAQNGGGGADLDVNITKSGGGSNIPWLWIVGGIVLLILIVALARGGGSRSTHRTTVIKDKS